MTSTKLIRGLGAADVVTGLVLVVAAGWLGQQVDVSTGVVRLTGAALALYGADAVLLAARPFMRPVAVGAELVSALIAVDLVVLGDPTAAGTAILLAAAALCVAAAAVLLRPGARTLVAA